MIPQTMTAVEIREPGAPQVLRAVERPVPQPGPGEVLIHVAAAGVNRPDVLQRKGIYPPPPGITDIPGLEVAGEVVRLGEGVREPALGARVCALVAGGGYAQYVSAPAVQCLPAPAPLSLEQAAVLPETFFTVWLNVFERARLKKGETLLVHGGASGIGTTAILLGKAFDAHVIVTAGSAQKCAACRELGADVAINYDMVGGDYLARNSAAAAVEGRIALIATQGGNKSELDLRPLMIKRLTISASTLRAQPVANKGRIAASLRENVWPLFETRGLKPVIHARFPLADAAGAHRLMESDTHIGKIVLLV